MGSSGAINVCLGGYDGTVVALELATEADGLLSLQANFAQATHAGAVRAIALDGPALLTGGVDETVRVYDVARRVEAGCLFQHTGTVSAARFFRDSRSSYALTGGHDTALCVWRTRDWRCLKRLQGHMAPVLDVAVHPTARLALSTAADRAVLMWSLVKGKAVFSAKVKGANAGRVHWSAHGQHYLLAAGVAVTVSDVEGRQTSAFAHERPVADAAFVDGNAVATAGDDAVVRVWDARSGKIARTGPTHEHRVVSVAAVENFVISADAKGGVKVWDTMAGDSARLETTVGGGDMLLTCMTACWAQTPVAQEAGPTKRKRRPKRGAGQVASTGDVKESEKSDALSVERQEDAAPSNALKASPKNAGVVPHKPKRKRRKKKKN